MVIGPLILTRFRVNTKNELKHEMGRCFYLVSSRKSCSPNLIPWNIPFFPVIPSSAVWCHLHVMTLFHIDDWGCESL